jgi:hypothetical protein
LKAANGFTSHHAVSICAALLVTGISQGALALGSAAPPNVTFAAVWIDTTGTNAPHLFADLNVEIPGGNVPLNVQGVTVTTPTGSTFTVPLQRQDLVVENEYFLDLTSAGVAGFPLGTYTFTVTDTAGGTKTVTDAIDSAAPLAAPASISMSGLLSVPSANGTINEIDLGATPRPTISWAAVPGALNYRLQIRNGFNDQPLFSRFTGNGTTTSMTLPAGVFVPGRRHYVRVEAHDNVNGLPASNARGKLTVEGVTQGPEIILSFGSTFTAGQTLTANVRAYNSGASSVKVNVQAWQGGPDGTVTALLTLPNVTIPSGVSGDYYNGAFYAHTFTGAEPNGTYVVGMRLIDPDTGETVAVTTRTYAKQ